MTWNVYCASASPNLCNEFVLIGRSGLAGKLDCTGVCLHMIVSLYICYWIWYMSVHNALIIYGLSKISSWCSCLPAYLVKEACPPMLCLCSSSKHLMYIDWPPINSCSLLEFWNTCRWRRAWRENWNKRPKIRSNLLRDWVRMITTILSTDGRYKLALSLCFLIHNQLRDREGNPGSTDWCGSFESYFHQSFINPTLVWLQQVQWYRTPVTIGSFTVFLQKQQCQVLWMAW